MSKSVRVALVQTVSSKSVAPNLDRLAALLAEAAKASPDAIFLPENFAALAADDPRAIGDAESAGSAPIQDFCRTKAAELGSMIFAGTMPLAHRPDGSPVPGGRVRAASLVYDASGDEVARYDKMHMFDVDVSDNQGAYRESATFEPGEDSVIVPCSLGQVGLSVCYDLRFPEFYRRLFESGADMVAAPSAFTRVTGQAHFELLMRARAVENTCFMIAACQGGDHDSGRQTWGHSMVVSPWGDVLGELESGEGVLTADLDLTELQRIRKEMPFKSQRQIY